MRTRRPTRSLGLAAAVLLLAGCGSQTGTDDASSTSGVTAGSSATTEAPTSAAGGSEATEDPAASPFPGNTDPDVADPVTPDGLTVTTVRAAHHEGYDRVVFELSGSGTPGWSVEYVDTPTSQGSGEVVDVPGAAFLQVTLQGTTYPYESGATEVARGAVAVSGTEVVDGVVYDATFEGTSVAWIGTGERTPFRVYALTAPSRVVVEVADAG
ncbi:AMIN-like domain-containing (lipo)protein [Modestobacter versicolor]|uniref:AMIN-like domain-containing protein n=1 Tax=Modestobacter versicolor TaxID=429133 RepID=A0A323VB95_9ACTN|nr:hypothetical protein [Modestobacter versicolor]MBB3677861.1 hypothetical protein [Modestobacter versicolor]PZA21303.1 hypothetical protein DMO24_10930 [Modestobacter versicolor]